MEIYLNDSLLSKCFFASKNKKIRKILSVETISDVDLHQIWDSIREMIRDTEIEKKDRNYWSMTFLKGALQIRDEKLNILLEKAKLFTENDKELRKEESIVREENDDKEEAPKTPEITKLNFPDIPDDINLLSEQQDKEIHIPRISSSPSFGKLDFERMMHEFELEFEHPELENVSASDIMPETPSKRPHSFVRGDDTPSKRRKISSMFLDDIEAGREAEQVGDSNMELDRNEPIQQFLDENEVEGVRRLDENSREMEINETIPPAEIINEREHEEQIDRNIPRTDIVENPELEIMPQISTSTDEEIPNSRPNVKLTKIKLNKKICLPEHLIYQRNYNFCERKLNIESMQLAQLSSKDLLKTPSREIENDNLLELFDDIFCNSFYTLQPRTSNVEQEEEQEEEPRVNETIDFEIENDNRRVSEAPLEEQIPDIDVTVARVSHAQDSRRRRTTDCVVQVPSISIDDQTMGYDTFEPISEPALESTFEPVIQRSRPILVRKSEEEIFAEIVNLLSSEETDSVNLDKIIPPDITNRITAVRCLICLLELMLKRKILLSQEICYGPIYVRLVILI
ncbi:uncharacterized protein LOC127288961 [Leptopilina boulardi]|uniref:uncharacterized protein LOC127288961 n=1 Tax=Leptopilina boulardi TaxID=63433 RepID=UPI0021F5EF8B|nr:uncharacterized protein LOC127288961 [Leptopilina boulardi]